MFLDDKPQGAPTVEPAKVGTLKLSTAIRIGAKLRPQDTDNGVVGMVRRGTSCALLAAYEVIEGWPAHAELGKFDSVSLTLWAEERIGLLAEKVAVKNDCDKWTREQIADWLESQGF